MKAAMTDGVSLPQEILTEVLSRLPVKSLCRFKCVSPSWNTLISHPHFVKTHLNRTNALNPKNLHQSDIAISSSLSSLYFIDFGDVKPTATKIDIPMTEQPAARKRVKVWGSCDGLLLVSYNHTFDFFLLNPSTREGKKLLAPPLLNNPVPTRRFSCGMGYDSSSDDYIVVMLSCFNTGSAEINSSMVDVYSLKTNAWRSTQQTQYVVVGKSSFCGGVFLNGCLHWLCRHNGSWVIGTFNLLDQIFREMLMPYSLSREYLASSCVEIVGGCLCLVKIQASYEIEVWKMVEYGVGESWTKLAIDLPTGMPGLRFLCQLAEDKLLLGNSKNDWTTLVVSDPKNEKLRGVWVNGIPNEFMFWSTYIESLVSPILR